MIKLTPMEEFYLREISKGKTVTEIGAENNVKRTTVTITINRLKKKYNLTRYDLIQAYQNKDYTVSFHKVNYKNYEQIMEDMIEVVNLRKKGYTTREIIKTLGDIND